MSSDRIFRMAIQNPFTPAPDVLATARAKMRASAGAPGPSRAEAVALLRAIAAAGGPDADRARQMLAEAGEKLVDPNSEAGKRLAAMLPPSTKATVEHRGRHSIFR